MNLLSVNELDLLEFFGTEPTPLDADICWKYNDSVYEVKESDLCLTFAITPASRDVRIRLLWQNRAIFELNAVDVDDVRVLGERRRRVLEVHLSTGNIVWLHVKPSITLHQKVSLI